MNGIFLHAAELLVPLLELPPEKAEVRSEEMGSFRQVGSPGKGGGGEELRGKEGFLDLVDDGLE